MIKVFCISLYEQLWTTLKTIHTCFSALVSYTMSLYSWHDASSKKLGNAFFPFLGAWGDLCQRAWVELCQWHNSPQLMFFIIIFELCTTLLYCIVIVHCIITFDH